MARSAGAGLVRIERPEEAPKVFQEAFNAGDLDGLVNLFEPEAMLYLGPSQPARNFTEIREAIAGFLALGWRLQIRLIAHHQVGNITFNTVKHTLRKNTSDGGVDTLRLRAAVVFRRQADGPWRFLVDNGDPFGQSTTRREEGCTVFGLGMRSFVESARVRRSSPHP